MKKTKQNKKMKKLLISILSLLILACINEVTPSKEPNNPNTPNAQNNKNSNANLIKNKQVGYATEERTTDVQEVAERLEIPRLRGKKTDLFIAHTIDKYGVNYCIEYDCVLRAARWTAYQWHRGMTSHEKNWSRNDWEKTEWGDDPFQPDPLIPRDFQVTTGEHKNDGYDMGHMLGSADRLNSKDANEQTFYTSNIHPQSNGFNTRGIWYALEDRLRDTYDKDSFRDTLYVVKGGLISEGMYAMSKHKLPVPKYFFMAILCHKASDTTQNGYKAIGFWMKHENNSSKDFKAYAVSIDKLEEETGIDFFCNLPDDIEEIVENNLVHSAWGLK